MTVIIGIDPHKHSHTAVALDEDDRVARVAARRRRPQPGRAAVDVRCTVARAGLGGGERQWLGRLPSRQLVVAGQPVLDVPAEPSARVRNLSGAGPKTDDHDARSTAIAARHARALRRVSLLT